MAIRIVIAGLVLAGTVPAAAALGQRPDISGRWAYNVAQSDNPRDQMRGGDSTGASRGAEAVPAEEAGRPARRRGLRGWARGFRRWARGAEAGRA